MGVQLQADDLQEIVALCDSDGMLLEWNRRGGGDHRFPARRRDRLPHRFDHRPRRSRHDRGDLRDPEDRHDTPRASDTPAHELRDGSARRGHLNTARHSGQGRRASSHLPRHDAQGAAPGATRQADLLYRGLVEDSPTSSTYWTPGRACSSSTTPWRSSWGTPRKSSSATTSSTSSIPRTASTPTGRCGSAAGPTGPRATSISASRQGGRARRYDMEFIYVSLDSIGLVPPRKPSALQGPRGPRDAGRGARHDGAHPVEGVSRQAELILPICSVCHKIRVSAGGREEWVSLADYVKGRPACCTPIHTALTTSRRLRRAR